MFKIALRFLIVVASFGVFSAPANAGVQSTFLPSYAMGLTVDGDNNAWVANRGQTGILKFSPSMQQIGTAVTNEFPWDVALDVNGNYYTTEGTSVVATPSKLRKYDADGNLQWTTAIAGLEHLIYSDAKIFSSSTTIKTFNATDGGALPDVFPPDEWVSSRQSDGDLLVVSENGPREYATDGTVKMSYPSIGEEYWNVTAGPGDDYFLSLVNRFVIERVNPAGQAVGSVPFSGRPQDFEMARDGSLWALTRPGASDVLSRIDDVTPVAKLEKISDRIETGDPIGFDASSSFVPFKSVSNFEWDFDGDGGFEQDTGTVGTVSHKFKQPGIYASAVRVTSPTGQTDVASREFSVLRKPRSGPLGVSISNGDVYTNDPRVTVEMRWPQFSETALISNDGGFLKAKEKPVLDTVDWKLVESGPERLPKTIYVRFSGGEVNGQTYQDDIILDQTPPVIISAGASSSSTSASISNRAIASSSGRGKIRVVRIRAKDKTSGVAKMRIASRKSKPGKWLKYKSKTKVKPASRLFVQVQDRAGNNSRWKTLKR